MATLSDPFAIFMSQRTQKFEGGFDDSQNSMSRFGNLLQPVSQTQSGNNETAIWKEDKISVLARMARRF